MYKSDLLRYMLNFFLVIWIVENFIKLKTLDMK